MLTVSEAARELRIGRTLAYQLVAVFEAGDPAGLPVVRLGNCLCVPRWALDELIRYGRVVSDMNAAAGATVGTQRANSLSTTTTALPPRNGRRVSTSRRTAQLSLLDGR